MELGNLIRTHRRRREFSQQELAARLGISPQYLNDIELGRRHPNDDAFIDRLALELQLNTDVVYFAAGVLPKEIADLRGSITVEQMADAFAAMREELFGRG